MPPTAFDNLPQPSIDFHSFPQPSVAFHNLPQPSTATFHSLHFRPLPALFPFTAALPPYSHSQPCSSHSHPALSPFTSRPRPSVHRYEALRASPKWGKTLLFVAYDDAGGYYDHVVPPAEGVPADEAPCHLTGPDTDPPYKCPGGGNAFDFRRLGLRTTSMLIGPMVPKGAVFQVGDHRGQWLDCF